MWGVRKALAVTALAIFVACAAPPSAPENAVLVEFDPAGAIEAPPQPYGPPEMGVVLHEHEDWTPARRDGAIAAIRAAGFRFARIDANWEYVERAGAFDFSWTRGLVDSLEAHGLDALVVLAYGHPAYGDHTLSTRRAEDGYVRYAREAARALAGRGVIYEIWNEPNVTDAEPSRFLPPDRFARIIARASTAIREVDPTARIVSGGLSWVDREYLDDMIAAQRTQPARLDAFGMHFYQGEGYPEPAAEGMWHTRETIAPVHGAALPVWNTEWGVSSASASGGDASRGGRDGQQRRLQAAMLARSFLTMWSVGAPLSVWYEFDDHDVDAGEDYANYGLRDHAGAPKPAYDAARAFIALSRNRTYAGVYGGLPEGVNAMRFDGPRDTLVAVWCEEGARARFVVPTQVLTGATDVMGAPLQRGRGAMAEFLLSQGDGPIYLTFAR